MSGEICTDNRFEIIASYKKTLVESTNIETSPDEMAVIDNVLFRFWQMGWLNPHKTEADRIRAMTDEQLAEYLCKLIREGVMMAIPGIHYSSADIEELNQNWLDWLKQEVEDGND